MEQKLKLFAKNLRVIRAIKGYNGKELSVKCGLKQQKRILDIEEFRGKPDLNEVIVICEVLEVGIDNMLNKEIEVEIKWN